MQHAAAVSFGVVATVGLIILIVAISTVSWVFVVENENSVNATQKRIGLFQVCTEESCETDEAYLHIAVQTLSLISTLAQIAGIICHIIKECHKKHPHLIHFVAGFFSLAAGAMFTAMSIYSSIYHPRPEVVSFGFSFALGWVSFVASFVLAIVAVVKAIKEIDNTKDSCNCNCC